MKGVFSSIAKSSAIIMGSRVILKSLSFVSFFLIITGLSLAEYGLVTLALSVSGPVLALSGLGQDDIVMARAARARGEKTWSAFAPTYGGFVIGKITITGVLVVLVFWFRELLGGDYRELLDRFFAPLIVWIAVTSLRALLDTTLQMQERFAWYAKANITENTVRLVIVVTLFFLGGLSVPSLLWAYVGAKIAGACFALPVLFGIPFVSVGPIVMVKAYAGFIATQGKWEVLRMLAGNLFSGINQWVVGLIMGLEAVAVLSFASAMNSFLAYLLPFRQILYPIMARLSSEGAASSFVARRMSKYSTWLNAAIILTAGIASPFVIGWFVPHYLSSVPVFWLLSFSQILNGISTSHGTMLYAYREQKFLFFLSLTGTVSALTFLPLLTWLFWVYGTVLESHLSSGLIIYLRERRLRKRHGISTFGAKDIFVFDEFDRSVFQRLKTAVKHRLTSRHSVRSSV